MKSLIGLLFVFFLQHTNLHKQLFGPCFYLGAPCTAANTVCTVFPGLGDNNDLNGGDSTAAFLRSKHRRPKREAAAADSATLKREKLRARADVPAARGGGGYGGGSGYETPAAPQPEYKYYDSRTDVQDQRTYILPITVNTYSTQKKLVKKNLFNLYRQHEHNHINTNVNTNVYKIAHPHVETEYVTRVQDKYEPKRYIAITKTESIEEKGEKVTPTEEVVRQTIEQPPEIVPVEVVKIGYDNQPLEPGKLYDAASAAAADARAVVLSGASAGGNSNTLAPQQQPLTARVQLRPREQPAPFAMTSAQPVSLRRRKRAATRKAQPYELVEKTVKPYTLQAMCMCAETFVPLSNGGDGCECPAGKTVQLDGRCA